MTKHARVDSGIVIETFIPPEGLTLAECFHPSIAEKFVTCDDDVEEQWTYREGVFAAPEPPEPAPERLDPLLAAAAMVDLIDKLERRVDELDRRVKVLENGRSRRRDGSGPNPSDSSR